MMKENKDFRIKPIGYIEYKKTGSLVYLNKKHKKGLKELIHFSHIWLFWKTGEKEIRASVAHLEDIEDSVLRLSHNPLPNHTPVLDIKPYMPMEDRVKDLPGGWFREQNQKGGDNSIPDMEQSDEINNIGFFNQKSGVTSIIFDSNKILFFQKIRKLNI